MSLICKQLLSVPNNNYKRSHNLYWLYHCLVILFLSFSLLLFIVIIFLFLYFLFLYLLLLFFSLILFIVIIFLFLSFLMFYCSFIYFILYVLLIIYCYYFYTHRILVLFQPNTPNNVLFSHVIWPLKWFYTKEWAKTLTCYCAGLISIYKKLYL